MKKRIKSTNFRTLERATYKGMAVFFFLFLSFFHIQLELFASNSFSLNVYELLASLEVTWELIVSAEKEEEREEMMRKRKKKKRRDGGGRCEGKEYERGVRNSR